MKQSKDKRKEYWGRWLKGSLVLLLMSSIALNCPDDDDDDGGPRRGVTVSPTTLSVEAGMTATYTVALDYQPSENVTITAASQDDTIVAVSDPATVTFTTENWETAQTVTVAGVAEGETTVEHSAEGGGYDTHEIGGVAVTVANPLVRLSATELSLFPEKSVAYTIALGEEPSADVTVALTSGDTDVATVNPATLTFTTSNWDTAQPVAVRGLTAGDTAVSHSVTSTDSDYNAVEVSDVDVAVGVGVFLSRRTAALAGTGATTYSLVLQARPSEDVTVTLTSSDPAIATVSPGTVDFTQTDWNVPQEVTVTGVAEGTVMISHEIADGDAGDEYEGLTIPDVTVEALASGTDIPGVTISVATLSIKGDGDDGTDEMGTYTVVLDEQPDEDVTITVTSSDGDVATVGDNDAATTTLTFTGGASGNWDTAQTVTVTGETDGVGATGAIISHSAESADEDYNGVDIGSVWVTVAPALTDLALDFENNSDASASAYCDSDMITVENATVECVDTPTISGADELGAKVLQVTVDDGADTEATLQLDFPIPINLAAGCDISMNVIPFSATDGGDIADNADITVGLDATAGGITAANPYEADRSTITVGDTIDSATKFADTYRLFDLSEDIVASDQERIDRITITIDPDNDDDVRTFLIDNIMTDTDTANMACSES